MKETGRQAEIPGRPIRAPLPTKKGIGGRCPPRQAGGPRYRGTPHFQRVRGLHRPRPRAVPADLPASSARSADIPRCRGGRVALPDFFSVSKVLAVAACRTTSPLINFFDEIAGRGASVRAGPGVVPGPEGHPARFPAPAYLPVRCPPTRPPQRGPVCCWMSSILRFFLLPNIPQLPAAIFQKGGLKSAVCSRSPGQWDAACCRPTKSQPKEMLPVAPPKPIVSVRGSRSWCRTASSRFLFRHRPREKSTIEKSFRPRSRAGPPTLTAGQPKQEPAQRTGLRSPGKPNFFYTPPSGLQKRSRRTPSCCAEKTSPVKSLFPGGPWAIPFLGLHAGVAGAVKPPWRRSSKSKRRPVWR